MADAAKRFERLGVINKILRDNRRDRYDHFLTNGFPKWRGTGYFYERFRPGLGSVVAFLLLLTALIQRVVLETNYRRDAGRMSKMRRSAQLVAWGPSFEAPASTGTAAEQARSSGSERKVRVPLGGFDGLPPKPKAVAGTPNAQQWAEHEKEMRQALAAQSSGGAARFGRFVDVFVGPDGNCEVLDPGSGDRLSLNEDAIAKPSMAQTWPVALGRKLLGSVTGGSGAGAQQEGQEQAEGYEVDGASARPSSSGKKGKKKRN